MKTDTRQQIADLISNIVNPVVICIAIIVLVSFESVTGTADAIRWSLILTGMTVLPIMLGLIYLVRKGKVTRIFTYIRQQRTIVYVIGAAFVAIGCAILYFSSAPKMLVVAFVAALIGTLIFMLINFKWKISLHTGAISALGAILSILYGWIGVISLVVVTLTGWARVETNHHTTAQVIGGAIMSFAIIFTVFRLFGL